MFRSFEPWRFPDRWLHTLIPGTQRLVLPFINIMESGIFELCVLLTFTLDSSVSFIEFEICCFIHIQVCNAWQPLVLASGWFLEVLSLVNLRFIIWCFYLSLHI
jgi:hypothetical protein